MPSVSRCSSCYLSFSGALNAGSLLACLRRARPHRVPALPSLNPVPTTEKCVIRWFQISEEQMLEMNLIFLNCPGLDPAYISQHQIIKFPKKQEAEARFFFFGGGRKFILFPSKQAEWAQTADNKIRSGNNYHPLRLDSHICMMLESIHKGKIN